MTALKLKFDTGPTEGPPHETILKDRRDLLRCMEQSPSSIYIRIPRTGSTSISNMLRNDNAWPHFYAKLIKDLIGEEEYSRRVVFDSVRNLWDGLVSWYMFQLDDHRAGPEQSRAYRELGFKGWIMEGCPHRGWSPHHHAHQPEDPISQLSFILDENGKDIVDHIVRLESAEQDFEVIREKLGLTRTSLPRMNVSGRRQFKDYRKYYDWESKDKARQLYGDDAKYFGYEF